MACKRAENNILIEGIMVIMVNGKQYSEILCSEAKHYVSEAKVWLLSIENLVKKEEPGPKHRNAA